MAALLELHLAQVATRGRAEEDSRQQPVWPTDWAKVSGRYAPSNRFSPVRPTEHHVVRRPAFVTEAEMADWRGEGGTTTSIVVNEYSHPQAFLADVPADAMPTYLRGPVFVGLPPAEEATAYAWLDFTPSFRRAKLESLLWHEPLKAARILLRMRSIENERSQQLHQMRQRTIRLVQIRQAAGHALRVTPDGQVFP